MKSTSSPGKAERKTLKQEVRHVSRRDSRPRLSMRAVGAVLRCASTKTALEAGGLAHILDRTRELLPSQTRASKIFPAPISLWIRGQESESPPRGGKAGSQGGGNACGILLWFAQPAIKQLICYDFRNGWQSGTTSRGFRDKGCRECTHFCNWTDSQSAPFDNDLLIGG